MRLLQLEYFLETANCLNFTNASKKLFISQPALSKQISLLEEELGVKLFERNNRKVMLTESGEYFKVKVEGIMLQLETVKKEVGKIGREKKEIRIACFDGAYTDDFLPEFYSYLKKECEEISISILKESFEKSKSLLDEDKVDMIFTLENAIADDIHYNLKRVASRDGTIVYSKKMPGLKEGKLSKEDLKACPLLITKAAKNSVFARKMVEDLKKLGVEKPAIRETENFSSLFTSLEFGEGIAILSKNVVKKSKNLGYKRFGDVLDTYVVAVCKKHNNEVTSY